MADTLTLNFGQGSGLTIDSDGDSGNLGLSVNIKETVALATIYTGSEEPSASLGKNGDIYMKVVE